MKLNYKNTCLVGLAFMSIIAFWQLYDNVVPVLLTQTFHLDEDITGFIMSLDNILSLFMLPLFGKISDKMTGHYCDIYRASLKDVRNAGKLATSVAHQIQDQNGVRKDIENKL